MNRSHADLVSCVGSLLPIVLIAALVTGCASIIKGSDQSVTFISDPAEARLVITDVRQEKEIHVGTTPFTTSLKRGAGYFKKAKYKVIIEKPGYSKEEVALEGTPNGWYLAGNLLLGGVIGWLIVDPATGAMWTLDPEDVMVTLKKEEALQSRGGGLTVLLRDELPHALKNKMKLVRSPSQNFQP